MFCRLLDGAREEVAAAETDGVLRADEGKVACEATPLRHRDSNFTREEAREIVDDLSEYLFDMWDANLTRDFKRIAEFESSVCLAFSKYSEGDEFTLEQGEAHAKYCGLFESLTEGYLASKGWSPEAFHSAMRDVMYNREHSSDCKELSDEVCMVIKSVLDMHVFAKEMAFLARQKSSVT